MISLNNFRFARGLVTGWLLVAGRKRKRKRSGQGSGPVLRSRRREWPVAVTWMTLVFCANQVRMRTAARTSVPPRLHTVRRCEPSSAPGRQLHTSKASTTVDTSLDFGRKPTRENARQNHYFSFSYFSAFELFRAATGARTGARGAPGHHARSAGAFFTPAAA